MNNKPITRGPSVDKSKSIFAQRMREKRRAKGWDQWEFAEMLGVSVESIGNWETDQRKPRIDVLVKMAKLLEVSTDWLLGLEG